jgi:putative PIN family toxin of toxin-antitoxin system
VNGFRVSGNLGSWFDFLETCNIICNMKSNRVVLDTNVLVAAARSRNGASFALLAALRLNRFRMLVSVPLFLEYEAVLKRPEQLAVGQRSVTMVDAFLDALVLRIEPVHMFYLWRPQLRDAADEMVLETALNGRADALVTFNVGDFDAAAKFALPVLAPAAFLQQLKQGEN